MREASAAGQRAELRSSGRHHREVRETGGSRSAAGSRGRAARRGARPGEAARCRADCGSHGERMTMDRRRVLQSVSLAWAGGGAVAASQGAETPQRPSAAAGQTRRLAEYAAALRYEDIPADVIQRAKDAIADTVAVATFGGDLPWSRMIAAYAKRNGTGGRSRILGQRDALVHAPSAALANGAFTHAFEMDNLTKPNSGSHPGATLLCPALAAEGFTGPATALEGDFGFLRVFCRDFDMDALTRGLGDTWATRSIMMKRYACHITAHTPVDSTLALRAAHGFKADDVASIAIAGTERMLRVNNIPAPKDVMMAQYSIPFCVALALYRNPVDPRSFDDSAAGDPQILGLASRVRMSVAPPPDNRADLTTTVTIALKDRRSFTRRATDFMGTPERPLGRAELREKFLLTSGECHGGEMARAFDRLQNLESEKDLGWIGA